MLSLQNILASEGQEFIDNLFNKEVVVTEKLNAATLSFRKEHTSEMDLNRKLTFYKGSGAGKKRITIADKVMTTFYASGMTYLNNMSGLIIDRIPANWTFVCRYFPNHQPSFINYSVLPKNNLVLSCIITNGGTKIDDADDLRGWAEMFDIAWQEPVFRGYLSEYQKERLTDYIKDGSNGKDSFARFIITMLNPSLTHSIYQEDGFDAPIDGFIFKFISDDGITKPVSAKLIDPYMSNLISRSKAKKGFEDNKDVLLSDFTIFMMSQDLDSIILTEKTDDDRYLELFYRLFNRYIKFKKAQLEDFDIDTNDIVKESIDIDFSVDLDKISNETTKKLLKENPEYRNIFKTLLGSFRTKKPEDYKSLVMAPNVVRMFNTMVDKIAEKSKEGHKSKNLSFSDYLSTIRKKDITTLDISNAPDEVKDEMGVSEPKETRQREPLSFADFKKKDERKEKKEDDEKRMDNIEDMIRQMKDSIKDISDEVRKSQKEGEKQTEKIEKLEDTTESIKDDEDGDDKKSAGTKHDEGEGAGDRKDGKHGDVKHDTGDDKHDDEDSDSDSEGSEDSDSDEGHDDVESDAADHDGEKGGDDDGGEDGKKDDDDTSDEDKDDKKEDKHSFGGL